MKKIKISELPPFRSLKGLWTIGTDADNRSCKVSLEFIEEETTKAVNNAEKATQATNTAIANAQTATQNANTATANAIAATTAANTAKTNADTATSNANAATTNANNAATNANTTAAAAKKTAEDAATKAAADTAAAVSKATTATDAAKKATEEAQKATEDALDATTHAEGATFDAEQATAQVLATLTKLIPDGLVVVAPERLTFGNTAQPIVEARLSPEDAPLNVLFISDNEAVRINQKGQIRIVAIGTSEVQVIPTLNTRLAKTIVIKVEAPTARLVNNRKTLRFTQSGALFLN